MHIVDGSTLTASELKALVEAPYLHIDSGIELLNTLDEFVMDISDHLIAEGSQVSMDTDSKLHRSANLILDIELQWGNARLRPYLLISSELPTWYYFPLGIFLVSTPDSDSSTVPIIYNVECLDKLDWLNTTHGESVYVEADTDIVTRVMRIIQATGENKVFIEPSSKRSESDMTWDLDDSTTTLDICNELLESIGHGPLYCDRSGWFRSESFVEPFDLPTVWNYDANSESTSVRMSRSVTKDYYHAANVVIGVNEDLLWSLPVEGDGMHTETNLTEGPTSIGERGGRRITKVISDTYVDQEALVTAVRKALEKEKNGYIEVSLDVSHNPIHDYRDVVTYNDSQLALKGRFFVTSWQMNLDTTDMQLNLRVVT
jgi:hypothetical protein